MIRRLETPPLDSGFGAGMTVGGRDSLVPATRFFVAGPPQNDILVGGEGRDGMDSGPRVGARGQAFRRNDEMGKCVRGSGRFANRPYGGLWLRGGLDMAREWVPVPASAGTGLHSQEQE